MKHHFHLMTCLAVMALGLAGCGRPSSMPLAMAPTPKSAAKAVPKKDEPKVAAPPAAEAKPAEEPKPAESAVTRPKADREPTRPGDPEKITFDDLILGMQADMVYRPFMLTDRAKELEGKRVRLTGEMYGGSFTGTAKAKGFVILRNKECKYGPGGQADHVADVKMKEGNTARFTSGTVRVEGTLRISPLNDDKDGNTKHIYVLEDAVLK
jgi:hypothetical protein